jgi:hypothetical protein
MLNLSKFIELFNLEIEKKKNFLIFLITGNKPLVSEIILSETIIKQITAKNDNKIRSNILDILSNKDDELIFFKFNKNKSNNNYIFYDVCLFLNKNEKNLYIFKNIYEDLNEELSETKLKDFIFLKTENDLQKKEIIGNKFKKINNLLSVRNLVENFGLDWLYKKSFFIKPNYYNTYKSFSYSKQELKFLSIDNANFLSDDFLIFSSARSAVNAVDDNKNIKFYGNSESFLNFFDENAGGFNLVKLNIGEPKFINAIQRLDNICSVKDLINNSIFSECDFTIQSGIILL